jgi:hypothetical protein
VERIERENRSFSEKFVVLQRQTSALYQLYVTSHRLHETLDKKQVVQVIEEIVNAIVGSEELAVFELKNEREPLALLRASGVAAEPLMSIRLGQGRIGEALESGQTYVAKSRDTPVVPHEEGLTACIPLMLGSLKVGAIAIFRLLPHKAGLVQLDHEVFDLLGSQAAMAIHCTRLHEQWSR